MREYMCLQQIAMAVCPPSITLGEMKGSLERWDLQKDFNEKGK